MSIKVATHAGMGPGTNFCIFIFFKHGYEEEYYSTIPRPYPLPSQWSAQGGIRAMVASFGSGRLGDARSR